jgi:plastocyanin
MRRQHRPVRQGKVKHLALLSGLLTTLVIMLVLTGCGGGTGATTTTAVGPTTTGGASTTEGASTTASSAAGGAGGQVVLKNFAFDPASVTIKAGESVTWTNQDSTTHTVDADNGEFKSGDLAPNATFTFKFDKAGTYAYHCSIHPSMKATVIVQ